MTFFKTLASGISVGENEANIAVIIATRTGGDPGIVAFDLTTFMTTQAVVRGLTNLTYTGVRGPFYHTYFAVNLALELLGETGRKDARGIIVTVTADTTLWWQQKTYPATMALSMGVDLIGIGLNLKDVDPIITSPAFEFLVKDSEAIPLLEPDVLAIVCKYAHSPTLSEIIYHHPDHVFDVFI